MTFVWWIGQALGLVAFFLSCAALVKTNDSSHRQMNATSAFIDVVHWVLLGAYTAGAMAFLIAIRVLTAELVNGKSLIIKIGFAVLYSVFFLGAATATWDDSFSALPVLSSLIATFAFMLASGINLRIWLFLCNIPWVIYGIHVHSIGGVLSAFMAMCLLAHTMLRMYFMKQANLRELEYAARN
jgi:hypothetical protein